MDVFGVPLQTIVEGTKQYLVPVFQRPYTWTKKEWKDLWEDLVDVSDPKARSHFIGAIVTLPWEATPATVTKYLLIDGQQRLSTILVLLSVIRDLARERMANSNLAEAIDESYLRNKFAEEESSRFKIMPSEADRQVFRAIMDGASHDPTQKLAHARKWFFERIKEKDEYDREYDLNVLKTTLVSKFVLVSISLAANDNPYLIFETLNARGTPLTQADLIRNFFFMKINPTDHAAQEQVYREKWLPMQSDLGEDLSEFFRHFLMKDGADIRKGDVYVTTKDRYGNRRSDDLSQELGQISVFAGYYRKLLVPQEENEASIRRGLERLNEWDVSTAYPLLMNIYALHAEDIVSANEFETALNYIESFIVRRFAVGISTRSLHRVFPDVSKNLSREKFLDSLKEGLGKHGWPDDRAFRQALEAAPLYSMSNASTLRILQALEESYGHREQADLSTASVEHAMPQTLTDEWKTTLGQSFQNIHDKYLHTLGNLTITAYNPTLQNKPFTEKKRIYAESHFELTKHLAAIDVWSEAAITGRAQKLSLEASKIWLRPD